jgi:predicted DNA-binding transcriptional regulator YafY
VFAPYLLEPSGIGFATYAIGHSSIVNQLRTYKIERIRKAELTRGEYTIPSDFDGLKLLRSAWSIFYGDEVIKVTLRFHPDVARRVQETNWHISQQLAWDEEQEGYLLMTIEVADTTDLKPWIRTWGANCEVLEPVSLRNELVSEARRLAKLYGWQFGGNRRRYNNIF